MSEFLAEASVLITPDTSKFRATLIAELEKASKGLVVPIPVVAQAKGARDAVQANKAAAASAQQASVATKELTTSRTRQIITDREAAAEEANLAKATQLLAAAQSRASAIEGAASGTTTELAAARKVLKASNVAVAASERAVQAASLQGAEALQAETAAALENAVALQATAKSAEADAAAKIIDSRATASATRSHAQLTRGLEAEGLHLFGIRGATLAASSSFLIGAAAVTVAAKAVEEANSNIEATARAEAVFGDAASRLESDAKGMAGSFGLSETAAIKFEGQIGNILKVSKIANDQIPQMSEGLVKLAADMAAFNNVPLDQVLKAISLGLVGNSRGLRQFGVELNAAAVNAEALRESGKKNTDELTRADKVLARTNLLYDQTIFQQNAAAKRADSLAGKTRTLKAELSNLGDTLGRALIPKLAELVTEGAFVVKTLDEIGGAAQTAASKVGGSQFGNFIGKVQTLFSPTSSPAARIKVLGEAWKLAFPDDVNRKITIIDASGKKLSLTWQELHDKAVTAFDEKQLNKFGSTLNGVIFQAEHLVRTLGQARVTGLSNQLATLQDRLVGIKVAGGDASAQLANLAQQQAKAQALVAADTAQVAVTHGRAPAVLAKLRSDRQALLDIIDQIKSIKKDQADAAQQAAQDIQDTITAALQKVKDLIEQADAATVDLLTTLAGSLDIRAMRVAATKSLVDDVAFQQQLQANIRKRIAIAQSSIIDAKLKKQTLHELNNELVASQIEEKRLLAEQAQNRQQRRQQAFDRAAESIDLDIQLAQTNKNVKAEIAARRRRIALDHQRMLAVRGDILATKRLRNDIAEQNAAIAELNKQLKKRNDLQADAQFLFLQQQAGFAGTLLSNLIPTAALTNTVGGGARAPVPGGITPTPVGGHGGATPIAPSGPSGGGGGGVIDTFGPRQPDLVGIGAQPPVRGGVSKATQTQTAQKGASMSQMSTLIHVQRQMLTVLMRLVGQRSHPEANAQRAAQHVSVDYVGW